ncbi:hypothetical protein [Corynebacterium sp. HMSC074A01]|uniref:hypothetical protein n=1 Tax=Corynebacterium sp. HMSC074A01 TaxID=1715030 RepID=UPI00114D157C|nr:hypothetical protein [Corynebacterium sp. HMSC074A01]
MASKYLHNRNFERYAELSQGVVMHHAGLQAFLKAPAKAGISTIAFPQTTLDLMLLQRNSPTLTIIFHAAADPAQVTLPLFVGQHLAEDLDSSVLFVSEPALELGAPIGWYAGCKTGPRQSDFQDIFEHIQSSIGATSLIFYGCSAGGFASLYYSHQTPGSLAIAVNPQTDIQKYHSDKVATFTEKCWPGGFPSSQDAHTNMVQLYEAPFANHVLYVQNIDDQFHRSNHFDPWYSEFKAGIGHDWAFLFGNWGKGHTAPPAFLQSVILKYAVALREDWPTLMRDPEFNQLPNP